MTSPSPHPIATLREQDTLLKACVRFCSPRAAGAGPESRKQIPPQKPSGPDPSDPSTEVIQANPSLFNNAWRAYWNLTPKP
jgi:hypothetical protein